MINRKNNKDDFYITIIRFGKERMAGGFRLQELADHMRLHGFEREVSTINSILLKEYSTSTFFSNSGKSFPDESAFYFLTPEAYFNLLHYDNIRSTRRLAILAIVISVVLGSLSVSYPICASSVLPSIPLAVA